MRVVNGSVLDVVVDNRKDSPTYMQWDSMILDDKRRRMVLMPPMVGNAFLVLSKYSVFSY